ncbi:hypothetical protein [Kitasatospora sp. McL0602]|uniref:hypothetical protein n=1 Tax=Kitasatospora sp. McL0602 TaxID=3439530 RepID=UPI003F8B7C66
MTATITRTSAPAAKPPVGRSAVRKPLPRRPTAARGTGTAKPQVIPTPATVVVPNPDLRALLAERAGGHCFVGRERRAEAHLAVVERSGWLLVGDAVLAEDGAPVPTGALPHHAAVAAGLLRQLATGHPGAWYAFDLDGQCLRGGQGVPDLR